MLANRNLELSMNGYVQTMRMNGHVPAMGMNGHLPGTISLPGAAIVTGAASGTQPLSQPPSRCTPKYITLISRTAQA
jgi:hypothetical protein